MYINSGKRIPTTNEEARLDTKQMIYWKWGEGAEWGMDQEGWIMDYGMDYVEKDVGSEG